MSRHAPSISLRLPLLAGSAVALCFFAGLGGWAATAPLAGAAIAPAVVAPDGSRKTVQHLEGGIVHRILVQDGSKVVAGQALIELDTTASQAEHAALLAQCQALLAAEARLMAEQAGAPTAAFPDELTAAAARDPALARVLASEADRLASRRAALADQQVGPGRAQHPGRGRDPRPGGPDRERPASARADRGGSRGRSDPARQGPRAQAAPAGAPAQPSSDRRCVSRAAGPGSPAPGR